MAVLLDSAQCVIGSMACELNAGRLRIVWFRWCAYLDQDLNSGTSLAGKAQQTYAEAKQRKVVRVRRYRQRLRAA